MFYIAVNHIYRWWVTLIFRSKVITQACVFKHEFVWIALFLSFLLDCNEAATAAVDVWWLRMTYSPPLFRCLYCIWINIGYILTSEPTMKMNRSKIIEKCGGLSRATDDARSMHIWCHCYTHTLDFFSYI